jgi:hypothetical protein
LSERFPKGGLAHALALLMLLMVLTAGRPAAADTVPLAPVGPALQSQRPTKASRPIFYGAPIQDFKVTAGGQAVAAEVRDGAYKSSDARWATFPLQFRKGEPLDLEVS